MAKQGPTIEVRACKTIRLLDDKPTIELGPGDSVKVCVQPRALKLHVCDAPEPPPLVYFTSKPYPVISIDEMPLDWTIDKLRFMPGEVDEMSLSFSVASIELRPILQSYEGEAEAMDLSFNVESLKLREALKQHTVDAEGMDVSFGIETLTLESQLVSHEQPEESMQLDWAVATLELS